MHRSRNTRQSRSQSSAVLVCGHTIGAQHVRHCAAARHHTSPPLFLHRLLGSLGTFLLVLPALALVHGQGFGLRRRRQRRGQVRRHGCNRVFTESRIGKRQIQPCRLARAAYRHGERSRCMDGGVAARHMLRHLRTVSAESSPADVVSTMHAALVRGHSSMQLPHTHPITTTSHRQAAAVPDCPSFALRGDRLSERFPSPRPRLRRALRHTGKTRTEGSKVRESAGRLPSLLLQSAERRRYSVKKHNAIPPCIVQSEAPRTPKRTLTPPAGATSRLLAWTSASRIHWSGLR